MAAPRVMTRRLPDMTTETALNVLACNIKRVAPVIGIRHLKGQKERAFDPLPRKRGDAPDPCDQQHQMQEVPKQTKCGPSRRLMSDAQPC